MVRATLVEGLRRRKQEYCYKEDVRKYYVGTNNLLKTGAALLAAVKLNDLSVALALLEQIPELLTIVDAKGNNVFHYASSRADGALLQVLLELAASRNWLR